MSRFRRSRRPRFELFENRSLLAAFAPGNVVIYRVSDGADLEVEGNDVFLDEYTTSGALVQSISLASDTVNGGTKTLRADGRAFGDGMLNRSVDGQSLAVPGYNAVTVASFSSERVVGLVGINGSVDLSTSGVFNAGQTFRSVIRNGNHLYTVGGSASVSGGTRMLTVGNGSSSTVISSTPPSSRTVAIFAGQLYISNGLGSTAVKIGAVGSGIPTTAGQTTTSLPGFPTSGPSPYQFFLADLNSGVAGVDTLYVADDVASGGQIQKFSLVSGSWTSSGAVAAPEVRGLTGVVNGTSVAIYATTGGKLAAGGGTLYSFTDTTGYNGTLSGTAASIATAAAKTAFRGIALAPDDGITPIGGLGAVLSYTAGDAAILSASSATFADASSLKGGSLTVSFSGGGTSQDSLAIVAGNGIAFSAGSVFFDGTQIGTYPTSGTGSGIAGESLVVTFNAPTSANPVTAAAVEALVRQMTFSTAAGAAAGNRILNFTVQQNDGQNTSSSQTINVAVANQAPQSIGFSNTADELAEDHDTSADVHLADINIVDDGLGANDLSLIGPDASFFAIANGALYLKLNTLLDFEDKSSYSVTVEVDDASVGSTPDAAQSFLLSITDVNEAPTAVVFSNVTSTLDEDSDTSSDVRLADIGIADDLLGTNNLSMSGDDAGFFVITGNALYLKSDTVLNFEDKDTYEVTVEVDDTGVGSSPDASQAFTLTIGDVNEAPTGVSFSAATTSLLENSDTSTDVQLADIDIADDVPGTNNLSLSGDDSAFFVIVGNALLLKAGTLLDFEDKSSYSVTVEVDDAAVGSAPDAVHTFVLTVTDVNESPTAIDLSDVTMSLPENTAVPSDLHVADIDVTDDGLGTNDLSLTGDDAGFFVITGNALFLKAGTVLDFENKASYSVTVRVDDASVGSTPDASALFTLTITDVNEAPAFTSSPGLTAVEDAVYTYNVSAADVDAGAVLTITATTLPTWLELTDNNNGTATLTGTPGNIRIGANNVVLEVSDGTNAVQQPFTITVSNTNDAPVINTSVAVNLDPIAEEVLAASNAGTLVSDLLGGITDVDPGAVQGIAVSSANNVAGTWQYTLDGTNWQDFGAVSRGAVRLLAPDATTRVRLLPKPNFNGTASLWFFAWDQTSGSPDGTADLTPVGTTGGTTAFSTNIRQAFLSVTPVNDAPKLNTGVTVNLDPIAEDVLTASNAGTLVSDLLGGITDIDAGAVQGIAVSSANNVAGTWQYTLDGTNWQSFGAVSKGAVRLLAADATTRVRLLPKPNFSGTASLWFFAWDQTSDSPGGTADLTPVGATGGTTAFSTNARQAFLSVTPVNDAPKLNTSVTVNLDPIAEDSTPVGTLVSDLLGGITDVDAGALQGIAVSGANNITGIWQYTLDGTNWQNFGAVSKGAVRLLAADATTRVRLLPNADFSGTAPLWFFAWDQTSGTPGGTADLTPVGATGGATAFSTNSRQAFVSVTPVNDAPVLGGISGTTGYTLGNSAVIVAPSATVSDVDSEDFDTGELRVRITDGASAANQLELSGFTIGAGEAVMQGTTQVGTRTSDGLNGNELRITLNANATLSVVEQLLRSVTFRATSTTGSRSLLFSVSDGDGDTSLELTKTVSVS